MNIQILSNSKTISVPSGNSANSDAITIPIKCFAVCTLQAAYTYNSVGRRTSAIQRNGITIVAEDVLPISGTPTNNHLLSYNVALNAGDTLNARIFQDSSGALSVTAALSVLIIPDI